MARLESMITFFGKPAKVACDGNCGKAWGIAARPRNQLSDDIDDYEFLTDSELGDAPVCAGTWEGGHGKPESTDEFPNKWCTRQCERSSMSKVGEYNQPLKLRDFSVRRMNMPHLHKST